MSQNYVGCCKQVYDSLGVCWLVYATVKECISCGKERSVWTASNMFQHICSKGHHSLLYNPKQDDIYLTFFTYVHIKHMQLTQWHHFEEDQNNPTQMAKYFSSPSRSQPSVYSQEEIYYLLGENNSMKKLLTEVMHRLDFSDRIQIQESTVFFNQSLQLINICKMF